MIVSQLRAAMERLEQLGHASAGVRMDVDNNFIRDIQSVFLDANGDVRLSDGQSDLAFEAEVEVPT